MAQRSATGLHKWAAMIVVGAVAGWLFWHYGSQSRTDKPRQPSVGHPTDSSVANEPDDEGQASADPIAVRYVRAFQQGDSDTVIDLTSWMQDRLARVQGESENGMTARDAERVRLRGKVRDRRVEGNQLREEGVEDKYVFLPEAEIQPLGTDAGRDDLDRPVRDRTWFQVTYPARSKALRDDMGIPIRSLVVGVNVSKDGLVLKASVTGNLEIVSDSVSYAWETAR